MSWTYQVINMVLQILSWLIVIRCILSWFPISGNNPLVRILYELTEPMMRPFRRIRFGGGASMIDFSPLFAILAIWAVQSFILPVIFRFIAGVIF